MYKNDISELYMEDIQGVREKAWEMYISDEKKYWLNVRPQETAYRLMLWLKYYRAEKIDFNIMISSLMEDFPYELSKLELTSYIKQVVLYLEKNHKIKVISQKPMILETDIPFTQLV